MATGDKFMGVPTSFLIEHGMPVQSPDDPDFVRLRTALRNSECVLLYRDEVPIRRPHGVMDDFAGRVLQAMVQAVLDTRADRDLPYDWGQQVGPAMARTAYEIAQAMMEERERRD